MERKSFLNIILILSIIGVCFSGYLTFTKVVLGVCALKEPCPILFGYPVCIYGLIFFTIILILTIFLILRRYEFRSLKALKYISIFAVAFSTYFAYQDLFVTCAGGWCKYTLGLPSCVYGLIMYVAILILTIFYSRNISNKNDLKIKKGKSKRGKK